MGDEGRGWFLSRPILPIMTPSPGKCASDWAFLSVIGEISHLRLRSQMGRFRGEDIGCPHVTLNTSTVCSLMFSSALKFLGHLIKH